MAYDEGVAGSIRKIPAKHRGVTKRKMFGGITFMLHGNMCCGVIGKNPVLRVGPERYGGMLSRVLVSAGVTYARTLPSK